ncbi:MAG: hypothetical protein Q7T82_13090 [Armatimonadota bacterium]|nr:hypothetical protein [Armatimonadota bacterium]
MRKTAFILAITTMAAVFCSSASAQTWISFKPATFTGIQLDLTSDLATQQYWYTVTLDPGATITFDSSTYQIAWLGGYFINGASETDLFFASDALYSDRWQWEATPVQDPLFNSVGWKCQGDNDRLHADTGGQMTFSLTSPDIWAVPTNSAYHVGYFDDKGKVKTDYFNGPPVPEPSGLQAGLAFLSGATALMGRRFRRTRASRR